MLQEMAFRCRLPCVAVSAFALIGTPYMVWWRGLQAGYRYKFIQRQPAAGQMMLNRQRISSTMSSLQIPRSARDAAQAVGEKHHPIKSMAAWMIGNSLWLVVGLAGKTAN
jgi:hypothetical protein